jgi:MFS family permease
LNKSAPNQNELDPLERETIRRVTWRLMPLLMLGMFVALLDRANIGMAATTMNKALGFSPAVFGFGAGIFFISYFLAEIPSNLILNKVGARRWIARIMLTWGLVSGLTAFVWDEWSFYGVRLLLGLAEAGFYPGVVLYMTWWFPSHYRTRMLAYFGAASNMASVIGPPVGGLLMEMNGVWGFEGWRWLFVVEAIPAVILAFLVWRYQTDRPQEATWLRPDQRNWLSKRLEAENAHRETIHKFSLAETLVSPKIWLLSLAFFGQNITYYGVIFFIPLIVQGLGVSTTWVGSVSGIPYLFAVVAMIYWGWHSDHTGERLWHCIAACLLCSAGLAAGVFIGVGQPVLTMIALCLAVAGNRAILTVFWSLPTAFLTGTAAAGGIAMINALGNLGGWVGPSLFGMVKQATGSSDIALASLALATVVSAIALLMVGHDRRLEKNPQRG